MNDADDGERSSAHLAPAGKLGRTNFAKMMAMEYIDDDEGDMPHSRATSVFRPSTSRAVLHVGDAVQAFMGATGPYNAVVAEVHDGGGEYTLDWTDGDPNGRRQSAINITARSDCFNTRKSNAHVRPAGVKAAMGRSMKRQREPSGGGSSGGASAEAPRSPWRRAALAGMHEGPKRVKEEHRPQTLNRLPARREAARPLAAGPPAAAPPAAAPQAAGAAIEEPVPAEARQLRRSVRGGAVKAKGMRDAATKALQQTRRQVGKMAWEYNDPDGAGYATAKSLYDSLEAMPGEEQYRAEVAVTLAYYHANPGDKGNGGTHLSTDLGMALHFFGEAKNLLVTRRAEALASKRTGGEGTGRAWFKITRALMQCIVDMAQALHNHACDGDTRIAAVHDGTSIELLQDAVSTYNEGWTLLNEDDVQTSIRKYQSARQWSDDIAPVWKRKDDAAAVLARGPAVAAEPVATAAAAAAPMPEGAAAPAAPAEVAAIPPAPVADPVATATAAAAAAPAAPVAAAAAAAPAAVSVRARLDALEEATGCQLAGSYMQRIRELEQMYGVAAPAAGVSLPSRLTAIEQAAGL
jgi:hypothetical protein